MYLIKEGSHYHCATEEQLQRYLIEFPKAKYIDVVGCEPRDLHAFLDKGTVPCEVFCQERKCEMTGETRFCNFHKKCMRECNQIKPFLDGRLPHLNELISHSESLFREGIQKYRIKTTNPHQPYFDIVLVPKGKLFFRGVESFIHPEDPVGHGRQHYPDRMVFLGSLSTALIYTRAHGADGEGIPNTFKSGSQVLTFMTTKDLILYDLNSWDNLRTTTVPEALWDDYDDVESIQNRGLYLDDPWGGAFVNPSGNLEELKEGETNRTSFFSHDGTLMNFLCQTKLFDGWYHDPRAPGEISTVGEEVAICNVKKSGVVRIPLELKVVNDHLSWTWLNNFIMVAEPELTISHDVISGKQINLDKRLQNLDLGIEDDAKTALVELSRGADGVVYRVTAGVYSGKLLKVDFNIYGSGIDRKAYDRIKDIPGIVSIIHIWTQGRYLMEQAPGIPISAGPIPEEYRGMAMFRLFTTIRMMHAQDVLHCDLTTRNVLVADGETTLIDMDRIEHLRRDIYSFDEGGSSRFTARIMDYTGSYKWSKVRELEAYLYVSWFIYGGWSEVPWEMWLNKYYYGKARAKAKNHVLLTKSPRWVKEFTRVLDRLYQEGENIEEADYDILQAIVERGASKRNKVSFSEIKEAVENIRPRF